MYVIRRVYDVKPGTARKVASLMQQQGDAYTAALALGLLREQPLDAINQHATRLAAYVCSQHGATPAIPDSFS